jgi:RNA polymerase sigma-70 factor (ECF subfamily)
MDDAELNPRLSQITTVWSIIFQAHEGGPESATEAQQRLMQRYGGAVYRYLLHLVRDPNVADELAQEFAYRFVRGDFKRVSPERGRFRNFVRTAVGNLVIDYHRRQRTRPRALPAEQLDNLIDLEPDRERDRQFLDSWRNELLMRAWNGLRELQETTGQPLYDVLRFRADHPELRSVQLAEQLSAQLGRPITSGGVRQTLHRARDRFASKLLDEVAQSLEHPSTEDLEQELSELGLLEYCRGVLRRRRGEA